MAAICPSLNVLTSPRSCDLEFTLRKQKLKEYLYYQPFSNTQQL